MAVREAGRIKTWSLLNRLTRSEDACSRSAGQAARLNLLPRLARLKRLGVIYSAGRNEITASKTVRQPTQRRSMVRRPGVRVSPGIEGVSARNPPSRTLKPDIKQEGDPELLRRCAAFCAANVNVEKTKSDPSAEDVRAAARILSQLPMNPKRKFTGWLGGKRCWRGQAILLPDSRRVFVWGCRRGRVIWSLDPEELLFSVAGAGSTWGFAPGPKVTLAKNSAAVLLGKLKRDVREKASALKSSTAQRNGCMPCHPGRKRGRPCGT